jgi:outer membrane protein OmpA-like peptidoglycan-associated protein
MSVEELSTILEGQVNATGTRNEFAPIYAQSRKALAGWKQAKKLDPENPQLNTLLQAVQATVQAAIAEARTLQLQRETDSLRLERLAVLEETRKVQTQITEAEQGFGSQLLGNLEKQRAATAAASKMADDNRLRADENARIANENARLAAEAQRHADSLKAEAMKRQEEARNRLNSLQSELIKVRQDARGIILSMSDILFEVDKAELTPELQVSLAKIAGILTVYSGSLLTIEGHTDNTGTKEHNQKLSEKRADNVKTFMQNNGLEAARLKSVGYGMEKPVADNATKEGLQKNRRVDLVISDPQLEGK